MTLTEYKQVSQTDYDKNVKEEPKEYGLGVRHVQSFLFFMCLALGYITRGHLGVTIVAMTNVQAKLNSTTRSVNYTVEEITNNFQVAIDNATYSSYGNEGVIKLSFDNTKLVDNLDNAEEIYNKTGKVETEVNFQENITSVWNVYRTYDWPKSRQEMVLGGFFMGYLVMMFPMGLVCQRWGGKVPLQVALLFTGVTSIAIPWLTAWGGWKLLSLCRAVQGLSQAGLYPGIHSLLANWVPVSERGTLSSLVYTGSGFGTIVAFQLGGVLGDSAWGWPSTFWVTGLMCLIGFTLLTVFGSNKPAQHRSISIDEKSYILGHSGEDTKKKNKTPWKKILTSAPAWACFSGHVGSGVSYVFLLTQVPTYMHAILHFDIKNSGLLSSLPYITAFFATIIIGYLSDFCTNRKILSLKQARIISGTVGGVGSAICVAAVSFIKDSSLAVVIFVLTLTTHTAGHTGWMVNYIDLAPNYSGALMAFGNTLCNAIVVCLPIIVSNVVTDVTNPHHWQIMFLVTAGLLVACNVIYALFISTEVQSWNISDETHDTEVVQLEELREKK